MNTLLLSIMSLVMTWTVETKSTISSSGDVPAQVAAEYACSYQKGSVRNGDSATLTLASMGGLTIERVEMYMRSNKSAGAGVISVYADVNSDLMDINSWTKLDRPLLTSEDLVDEYGPGHNSFPRMGCPNHVSV